LHLRSVVVSWSRSILVVGGGPGCAADLLPENNAAEFTLACPPVEADGPVCSRLVCLLFGT
jgi:hypothetical protein